MSAAATPPRTGRPYTQYLVAYLALTIGSVWAMTLFYLTNYDVAVSVIGELQLTNPLVVVILHSPMIAALGILAHYDGRRGVMNFLRTLVPRRKDMVWLPVLAGLMVAYIFGIRGLCLAFGLPVPPDPQGPLEMVVTFLRLFVMEIGMVAITIGWYGFFLPFMHRVTGNHVLSGIATGLGIGVFVAPGNLFSSFELATAWPLYAAQLCVLSIGMSYLLSRMKGNVLFFLNPFWVSASGSAMRLYYFTAQTQVVQISLFAVLVIVLVVVLRTQARGGALDEPHTFPEYLEHVYTARKGAVYPGHGDRSLVDQAVAVQGEGRVREGATA